jgi:hypothetical protein
MYTRCDITIAVRKVRKGREGRLRSGIVLVALAVLPALMLVAGCTGKTQTAQPTPAPSVTLPSTPATTAAATSAPDTPASASSKAVAAYVAMWTAFDAAQAIPDPAYPQLAQAATGEALETLTKAVADTKSKGLKGVGRAKLSPKVFQIAPTDHPTAIRIRDCLNTAGTRLVNATPGATPYRDTPGGRRSAVAFVDRQPDGNWKVSSVGVRDVGTC